MSIKATLAKHCITLFTTMDRQQRSNNSTKTKKETLDNPEYLWYKSPVRFSSISSVVQYIKDEARHDVRLRSRALKTFKKFSQKIILGTRSFQRIDKKRQFHYILGSKNYLFQMDIADLFGNNRDRISELNDSSKYILIIVNSLTKRVYAYPLTNRENINIIKVLKTAFKDMGLKECENKKRFLTNIQVDKEFIFGKILQSFFKRFCVNVYYTQSVFKASMAERFVKYCKEKVSTRMEALRTEEWIPLLKDVVLQYNTMRKQSSTGLTPMTAEKYPSAAFIRLLERNNKKDLKYPIKKSYKFKIGDRVRLLQNSSNPFRKSYQRRYTANSFIIYHRRKVENVYIYYLKTSTDKKLNGSYRQDALRLASIDGEVYPYKVVEKRNNQTKVHWDGFPDSEDEWIPDNQLAQRRIQNKQ